MAAENLTLIDEFESNLQVEDLSITLVERRKRLHVLATEINNWEDELNKNPNYLASMSTPPQSSNAPSTSILSFDRSTPTNNHISKSPVVKLGNKENSSPSKRKLNETASTSESKLTNSEILSVAHRILSKNNSNSAVVQSKVPKTDDVNICGSYSAGKSVKDRRSKFEDKSDGSFVLTPKSIIKKFEQMSKDNGQVHQATVTATQPITTLKTSSSSLDQNVNKPVAPIFPNLAKIAQQNPTKTEQAPSSSHGIYSENINPKSIIHKFEQMVRNNGQQQAATEQQAIIPKSLSSGTNFSENNRASLTYISSVISDHSPRDFDDDEEEDEEQNESNERTYKVSESETSEIYEEVSYESHTVNNQDSTEQDTCETTSLFEDEPTTTESQTGNCETYSLSSNYSGSCLNQDFEDVDHEESENEQEAADDCCYSEYTDTEQTYDEQNYQISSTASYSPGQSEFDEHHIDIEPLKNNAAGVKSPLSAVNIVLKSPAKSITIMTREEPNSEPLFSIKEYRRQKRQGLPNGSYRRSSIATGMKSKVNDSAEKAKKVVKASESDEVLSVEDVNVKKAKYAERIKELDELIKQEDNIIHQTGIALERCLTDTLFTGSSEHIECNRILLISCQKRQAYSTEISRLKQLINLLNKKPQHRVTSAADNENTADNLTGLLIFSDLQLPIKESYLNKLKSGDEKRIFYFLCLIRNGIQVLQTQVISVQELIATRDTSITFPNRMAISNVDVNFKVKIDIYTLEIMPKEIKHSKSTSLASTSKFFSPFKNTLFHSNHDSNTGNFGSSTNSNHHYNEQNSLGVSSGGAKTSNFIHIDTIEITNKDLSSNRFKLSISSSSIPLTGVLFVTVRCMPSKSIELKGFMTLHEDVDGIRSWDRRWCFLNNYNISFWKYPEDEYRQSPLGIINLTKCVNDKVSILPRDICARKYTFELGINESEMTRYRLSADTKDQANDWLTNVNYALANLKLWNPQSNKSIKK